MASTITQVGGDFVREWLTANPVEGETVGKRGRFSASQKARFAEAHKGTHRYVEGKAVATVPLKVKVVSKKTGKARTETKNFTVAEVRAAAATLGETPDRGPLSKSTLEKAAEALSEKPTA